ncbi:MAG: TetR family transcriptional regulator [Hyphomicrobiaceae bacterium]
MDPLPDKSKIIDAAMRLASERSWADVSMRDIAEEASVTLADLRRVFGSKTQIVAAYIKRIDSDILGKVPQREAGQSPRDALFEILMARFDAMAPHKAALRSIDAATTLDTTLLGSLLNSQRWMLMAAGLDGDGPRGTLRTTGLMTLFASVFRVWLQDDDPGLARTMAALDRRLRRAEASMSAIDQACDGAQRLGKSIIAGLTGLADRAAGKRRRSDADGSEGPRYDAAPDAAG